MQHFSVYCRALCELWEDTMPDDAIIQPVLQEIQTSLHRCFFKEAGGLYAGQREQLQILSTTLQSMTEAAPHESLVFEGKYFSAKFRSVQLHQKFIGN